jgi:hypothetical protein
MDRYDLNSHTMAGFKPGALVTGSLFAASITANITGSLEATVNPRTVK